MKILINTLTPTEIWAIREQQVKDGVEEKDLFTGIYTIKGELFIPGEWKHVPDNFDTSAYPKIMDVKDYLEQETKRILTENGLNRFALGVKESYEMYEKPVPSIATDIAKYAPVATAETEPQGIE